MSLPSLTYSTLSLQAVSTASRLTFLNNQISMRHCHLCDILYVATVCIVLLCNTVSINIFPNVCNGVIQSGSAC